MSGSEAKEPIGGEEQVVSSEENVKKPSSVKRTGPLSIAFLSGKGGVGQSMLAANVGIYLAQSGKRVLLVDAVNWGLNLHTFLDIPAPTRTLETLSENSEESIGDLVLGTPYSNLKLLCGMVEAPAAFEAAKLPWLIGELRKTSYDFVLLDLGSHFSFNVFDHAIWSDMSILTTVPEPTAIERTYELLRSIFFRFFKTIERRLGIEEVVEKAMVNGPELGIKTPRDLVNAIRFFKPEAGDRMMEEIKRLRLHLVMNQVRSEGEEDVGHGMLSVCRRYFGLNISYLGIIDHDNSVPVSIRQRKPLALVQKDAGVTQQLERIAHKLLSLEISDKREDNSE